MNRFSRVVCPGLALLLLSTSMASAEHGDNPEAFNAMAGPVFGIYSSGGVVRALIGFEGGVGIGPQRVNVGVTRRRVRDAPKNEAFAYLALDPWLLLGGTVGVGVGTDSGVFPVLGVWEGLPFQVDTLGCDEGGTIAAISIGYRYTGVHEVYITPKIGYGSFPCFGGGRPLRAGERVLLPVACGRPSRDPQQAEVARHWLDAARMEASSISSFVRLAEELRLADAPDALIAAARTAARDEARHTMLCMRAAGGGHVAAPPRAPARPAPTCDAAMIRLAVEAWREGCVGEGIAAAEAASAAVRAREPNALAAQQMIAPDEARHAELSWAILSWAWRAGSGRVRDAIAETFANTHPQPSEPAGPPRDLDRLAWHGVPMERATAERATETALRRAAELQQS